MFIGQDLPGIFGMSAEAWGDDRVVRWSAFGIATVLVLAFAARTWERKRAFLSPFAVHWFRSKRLDATWEDDVPVRRDAESHRGRLLLVAGTLGMYLELLAALSLIPGVLIFADTHDLLYLFIGVPLFVPGLALVIATRVLAKRDLVRMASGHIDPEGTADTADAGSMAYYGVALCVVWLMLAVASWLAF
jgi:hypothetical protein